MSHTFDAKNELPDRQNDVVLLGVTNKEPKAYDNVAAAYYTPPKSEYAISPSKADRVENGDKPKQLCTKPYAGMSKEELLQFSRQPFWVRLRWTGFVIFWLGFLGIFAAVITLLIIEEKCPVKEIHWWQNTTIYQIYPRSFQDSDGDGIGDLKGIESRLDHLVDLGVGAIWLSPVYKSPMKDFGYDVSDFLDIDPIFGTMADFDSLLAAMQEKGLKLIMDFIPNHSSDLHAWFIASRENDTNKYSDYYVWVNKRDCSHMSCDDDCKDVEPQGCPPNNWLSVFGNSSWEWDDSRQQYYLHQFLKEQPDLNFYNDDVIKEMNDVLTFWMEKGVDGFREDAVKHMVEVNDYYNMDEPLSGQEGATEDQYEYLNHIHTTDLPLTREIMKEWQNLFIAYGENNDKYIFSVAEVYSPLNVTMLYYDVADISFNFELIKLGGKDCHSGICLHELVKSWLDYMIDDRWANWVVGNHDNHRIASKLGELYVNAINAVLLLLPGTPTSYYGEEIGMMNVNISWEQTQDPFGLNFGPDRYHEFSRDPERTPMQWNSSQPSAGFSTTNETWLPVHENFTSLNVEIQKPVENSTLNLYKELIKLRKEYISFREGGYKLAEPNENLFSFSRNYLHGEPSFLVVANVGFANETYHYEEDVTGADKSGEVVMGYSENFKTGDTLNIDGGITLNPGEFAVIKFFQY